MIKSQLIISAICGGNSQHTKAGDSSQFYHYTRPTIDPTSHMRDGWLWWWDQTRCGTRFHIACYSYLLTFVRKEINNITNKRNMYITRITKTTKFQTCMNTEDHQDKRCHYQCDDCGQDIQENTVRRKYCLIWKFHLHQIHCCIPC